jgi:tetratricopeptide (TPR) repeat protein
LLPLEAKKAPLYASLGHAHQLKGDIDKAIASFNLSLKHDAEDDIVHFNLGMAYETKGMLAEALNAYKTAYELNPESKKAAARYRETRIKILKKQIQGREAVR